VGYGSNPPGSGFSAGKTWMAAAWATGVCAMGLRKLRFVKNARTGNDELIDFRRKCVLKYSLDDSGESTKTGDSSGPGR
jgi:hypothetical protein